MAGTARRSAAAQAPRPPAPPPAIAPWPTLRHCGKHAGERRWDLVRLENLDEQRQISVAAAVRRLEPARQPLCSCATAPRRLILEVPERLELTLCLEQLLDPRHAHGADQLVL